MKKRYLIFISSTYEDLKVEREKVISAVLELKHIPTGMEQFPAVGIPPMDLIKKVLKECDYYILIIGARYGSLSNNNISYTEEEYNYARSLGIPVIAFIPSNPDSFPLSKTDKDPSKLQQLKDFKERVKKGGITIQYWDNPDHLKSLVLTSIPETIECQPRTGWVRADTMVSGIEKESFAKLEEEIGSLRTNNSQLQQKISVLEETNKIAEKENKRLKDELINLKASQNHNAGNLLPKSVADQENENADHWSKFYRVNVNVRYTYDYHHYNFNYKVEYSLKDWFKMIGLILRKKSTSIMYQFDIVKELEARILKDSYYNKLFKDKAGKMVQPKTFSKITSIIYNTGLKLTKIDIKEECINDIFEALVNEQYLAKEGRFYKLTEDGEYYLVQNCL